jgi:uncharacterized membrane protein YfcA
MAIAPAQAAAALLGARLAQHVAADSLSRIVAVAMVATGARYAGRQRDRLVIPAGPVS